MPQTLPWLPSSSAFGRHCPGITAHPCSASKLISATRLCQTTSSSRSTSADSCGFRCCSSGHRLPAWHERAEPSGIDSQAEELSLTHFNSRQCHSSRSSTSQPLAQLRQAAAHLCALAMVSCLAVAPAAEARPPLSAEEEATIGVFRRNTPSVVYITNLANRRDTFTLDMLQIPQGAGSGFVWDDAGHVVTNYHVVKGAQDLQVSLQPNQQYSAKVIGYDEDKDVAVLQVLGPSPDRRDRKAALAESLGQGSAPAPPPARLPLQAIALGTSADLLVGQKVYAIGNPFGLDHTLTSGVISGTGREISSGNTGRPIQDVIQTDAAINPGNSGGPLLDSAGSLIGINTAIYSPSGANSGVGFAIPVDSVRGSVEQIINLGRVVHPVIGIAFAPDAAVEDLGVTGILVLDAKEGGPAWKAGIHGTKRDDWGRLVYGDIITEFQGTRIRTMSDLYKSLDKCSIGQEVDVELLRKEQKEHVKVQLQSS